MYGFALPLGWALTFGGLAATEPPGPAPTARTEAAARATAWRGFTLGDPTATHELRFGFLGQMRASVQDRSHTAPDAGLQLELARPIVAASLWRGRVRMRLMPEFAGGQPALLDATVTLALHRSARVVVGQFRPWLSRGFRTGLDVLGVPGRGPVVDRFRVDRDVGVTMRGDAFDAVFEYAVGVFNGGGRGARALSPSPLFAARMVVAPLGPVPYSQIPYIRERGLAGGRRGVQPRNPLAVAVGGSVYTVQNRETIELGDFSRRTQPRRRSGASGDVVVSRRRVYSMVEGFYEHRVGTTSVPSRQAWGVYGQAGVLVWSPFFDVTVRSGIMSDAEEAAVVEPGLGVYPLGNHGKLQLAYRRDEALSALALDGHAATLQAQLSF